MNTWLLLKLAKDDVRKVPSTLSEERSQNINNTCSKWFDSDLIKSSPISSPTRDTIPESFKIVSDLEKSSDYLFVGPCGSLTEPTKKYAAHTNNFLRYFEESTPEKSVDSIDQMQKKKKVLT